MHRLYQRDKSLPQPRQLLFYHSNLDFGFLDEQGRYVFLHDLFKHDVCVIKDMYLCVLITKRRNYVSSRDENI